MKLFTIGFTKISAEAFFATLRNNSVRSVIDTRIHRDGQLSGFAKATDLKFFLQSLTSITYKVNLQLAPEEDLLKRYRTKVINWDTYASEYVALLRERRPELDVSVSGFSAACLLCSEHTPEKCHRRLAAEYLRAAYDGALEIVHL